MSSKPPPFVPSVGVLGLELEQLCATVAELKRLEADGNRYTQGWLVQRAHALAHSQRIAAWYLEQGGAELLARVGRFRDLDPADAAGVPAVHLIVDTDGQITVRLELGGLWVDAISDRHAPGEIISHIAEPAGILERAGATALELEAELGPPFRPCAKCERPSVCGSVRKCWIDKLGGSWAR